ncbi:MAG UNVERIFIED_CONTAM: hypothetical protein LVQ98_06895 [Rickettsiaceae bacterium]
MPNIPSSHLATYGLEIKGLHITANGNNQYESAIKANIDGMRRALTSSS